MLPDRNKRGYEAGIGWVLGSDRGDFICKLVLMPSLKILSSQKGGFKRGTNWFASTLYTNRRSFLGTVKWLLSCFKFEKTGYSFCSLKKVESFFMWSALPKTQRRINALQPIWWYSPCRHHSCNDSWNITTNLQNYSFMFPYSIFLSMAVAMILHLSLQLLWWQWDYRYMGCSNYQISELASYVLAHTYNSTAISKLSYSSYRYQQK